MSITLNQIFTICSWWDRELLFKIDCQTYKILNSGHDLNKHIVGQLSWMNKRHGKYAQMNDQSVARAHKINLDYFVA